MPCFSLKKNLPPPTRAWKCFTSTLQSKLHKLKQSKSIKNTKKQLHTLSTFLNRMRWPRLNLSPHANHSQRHLHWSFPPVYADDLFSDPASMPVKLMEPTTSEMGQKGATTSKGTGSSKAVQLPLWGVDERAEKFIAMFYEDMRLQRERSLGEYQEMLARGAM